MFFFSVEYGMRLLSCPGGASGLWSFLVAPLNIVDFVAIFPYYLEWALLSDNQSSGTSAFRVVRLVRVFRVFKVGKYVASHRSNSL